MLGVYEGQGQIALVIIYDLEILKPTSVFIIVSCTCFVLIINRDTLLRIFFHCRFCRKKVLQLTRLLLTSLY